MDIDSVYYEWREINRASSIKQAFSAGAAMTSERVKELESERKDANTIIQGMKAEIDDQQRRLKNQEREIRGLQENYKKANPLHVLKEEDSRPQRGGWAPGGYTSTCRTCGDGYIGDKRSWLCADCAYKDAEPTPTRTLSEELMSIAPMITGEEPVPAGVIDKLPKSPSRSWEDDAAQNKAINALIEKVEAMERQGGKAR